MSRWSDGSQKISTYAQCASAGSGWPIKTLGLLCGRTKRHQISPHTNILIDNCIQVLLALDHNSLGVES
jgi:hypothetical protein